MNLPERNDEIEWTKRVTPRLPFAAQGKKPCHDVSDVVRLWPRVEMSRSFVLNELRRILHICQNRVEVQPQYSKLRAFLQLESGRLGRALKRGGTRESRGGWALLRPGEAFDNILF